MAYENLCMYCFEDLGGRDTCPHCGRDARAAVPQIQMVPGTLEVPRSSAITSESTLFRITGKIMLICSAVFLLA